MRWAVLAIAAAACSEPSGLRIDGATPPYGPLAGGTEIQLAGTGFSTATRISVAGREAPLVRIIDEHTVGVVVPPGARAGDAELVVFDGTTSTTARGVFHYSTAPTLTTAAPGDVVYTDSPEMTLTGSGFLDEGAGPPLVLVDGVPASEVRVTGDRTLVFSAWPGVPLVRPTIQVTNTRGTATLARAFRYRPSAHDGLVLFRAYGDALADFFDPTDNSLVPIPYVTEPPSRYTAAVRDAAGDYLVLDRGQQFGRLDPRTTTIEHPARLSTLLPTIVEADGAYYAIDRINLRFGSFDPPSGTFTPLGTSAVPCCGSYGLAFDGATLYMASRAGTGVTITPVSTAGELGTPVPIVAPPQFHVEEMRFFHGVLYAASRDGTLVTIDPATGATTVLPLPPMRYKAMEVFE